MNKTSISLLFLLFISISQSLPHGTLVNLDKRNEEILNLEIESRMIMFKLTSGLNEIYKNASLESSKIILSKRNPIIIQARQDMFKHYNAQLLNGAQYKLSKKDREDMVAMLWTKLTSYLFMIDQLDFHNGILL